MLDHGQSAIRIVREAEGIRDRIARVEPAARQHQCREVGPAHHAIVGVPRPLREVLDGGEQAAVSDDVESGDVEPPPALPRGVGEGAVLHQRRVVVAEVAVGHPQRCEDRRVGEFAERLARDALHEDRQQHVAGVAVQMASAGIEVERFLTAHQIEEPSLGERPVGRPARHPEHTEVIAKSARVMDQVPDGDRLAEVGHLGNPLPNVVVEREFPLLREHRDRECRELFRDRRGVERRVRRDRRVVLQTRHPVALGEHRCSALEHRDGAARRVALVVRGEDRIDARIGRLARQRRSERECAEKRQRRR